MVPSSAMATDVGTGSIGIICGDAFGSMDAVGSGGSAWNTTGKTPTTLIVPSLATLKRSLAPESTTSTLPSAAMASPLTLESGVALPGWSLSGLLATSNAARSATLVATPSAPALYSWPMPSPPVMVARRSAAPTPGPPTVNQRVPSEATTTPEGPSVSPVSVTPDARPSTTLVAAPPSTLLMEPLGPKHMWPSSGCWIHPAVPPVPDSAT